MTVSLEFIQNSFSCFAGFVKCFQAKSGIFFISEIGSLCFRVTLLQGLPCSVKAALLFSLTGKLGSILKGLCSFQPAWCGHRRNDNQRNIAILVQ
ncbi:hypothetical protein DsansV1_C17g0143361 [Dioscorea sansibarensis]